MTPEQTEELERARGKLIEARQNHARSIANNSGEMADGLIVRMIDIQEPIEAIEPRDQGRTKVHRSEKVRGPAALQQPKCPNLNPGVS